MNFLNLPILKKSTHKKTLFTKQHVPPQSLLSLLQSAGTLPTCTEALVTAPGERALFFMVCGEKEQYLFKSQQ